MARMIKCPTCGTQIEIQSAGGQVIKCPGCGKGLKLVAKKPPGAGAPAREPGASSHGSVAGGSVAGGSVSAMSFHGEPPAGDLPSLDSNCAVCDRPTDPEDLVEDNGKLICRDCVKGARSRIERPAGGTELLDFKQAAPAPLKRGRVINFTPAFFAACLAGLVWGAAHLYLELMVKPGGSKVVASPTPQPEPPPVAPVDPPPTVEIPSSTDPGVAPVPPPPADPPVPEPVVTDPPPVDPTPAPADPSGDPPADPTEVATNVNPGEPPREPGSTLFPPDESPLPAPVDPPVEPEPAPVVSSDPLYRGLEQLHAGDYAAAARDFETARKRHIVGSAANVPLTAEQSLTLNGLAAAYIGQGKPSAAETVLTLALRRGDTSRAMTMNRAIVAMLHQPTLQKLGVAANDLKLYLDATPGDELAASLFGTMLARTSAMPNAPKEKIEPFWEYLDKYNDAIAAKRQDGKLKWGTEWLAAEDVQRYRAARKAGSGVSVTEAAKQLEAARARLKLAQNSLAMAQKNGGDVIGAERGVESAQAAVQEAETTLQAAAATVAPQKWLEKFEPIIPVPQ